MMLMASANVSLPTINVQVVSADAAHGTGSLRQQLLELELQLDEHRDREQVCNRSFMQPHKSCA